MSLNSSRTSANKKKKAFIIGLDCAAPELVFELWGDRLPNLRRVMANGVFGKLESATPPITVPAWMCMMTGKDPGSLGIYGFRNRKDHSYDGLQFASSRLVQCRTLWDVLADHGKRSVALGVPLTYPPKPILGELVSDFLAPDAQANYTYPAELKEEIKEVVGDYIFDTREFRTENKAKLLAEIYEMTAQRFKLAKHFIKTKDWDFFVMVEMGPDRIHHAFWKFFDPKHPKYVAGNPLEHAIRDYYAALDAEIGDLINLLDDDTRVLIVSDHGAKRMDGGICFNDWLIREGYLVLKEAPEGIVKFKPELVDWSKTKAWGDGGYYGRLFLNVCEREPSGIVPQAEVENLKRELIEKLIFLGDEDGNSIGTQIFRPEEAYAETRNVSPDLIVYFGDLHWRSVGTVGNPSVWTHDNDTGPDDANHAQHGIFIMADASELKGVEWVPPVAALSKNRLDGLSLYDVAPTVLTAMGVAVPPEMGRNCIEMPGAERNDSEVYSEAEEEELARRLEDLGYL